MDPITKVAGGALPAVAYSVRGVGTRATGSEPKGAVEQVPPAQAPPSELSDAVERLNRELAQVSPRVTFVLLPESQRMMVRVINPETNEVLRQIPPEEFLQLARQLDKLEGLLADETA